MKGDAIISRSKKMVRKRRDRILSAASAPDPRRPALVSIGSGTKSILIGPFPLIHIPIPSSFVLLFFICGGFRFLSLFLLVDRKLV